MKASDIRNHIAASCGYTEPSKAIPAEALDQMQRESWASIESQRKYWETRDHGGNVLPDRIQANHDQSEERVFDGEDVEEWQHQSEQQGAE